MGEPQELHVLKASRDVSCVGRVGELSGSGVEYPMGPGPHDEFLLPLGSLASLGLIAREGVQGTLTKDVVPAADVDGRDLNVAILILGLHRIIVRVQKGVLRQLVEKK